jgi:hypothetical protein
MLHVHQSTTQLSGLEVVDEIIKRHKSNHLFIYLKNAIHIVFSIPRHVKFGDEIGTVVAMRNFKRQSKASESWKSQDIYLLVYSRVSQNLSVFN